MTDRHTSLNEENTRLRKSLVTQINQRAYFQDEYSKSQRRCAQLLAEQYALKEEHSNLLTRCKELADLVEAHEQTNEALQRQLADAFTEEAVEQCRRLREAVNKLGTDLETERDRTKGEEAKVVTLRAQLIEMEREMTNLKLRVTENEESWTDRLKVLTEQLKLANSLKEEYKKRLKA